MVLSERAKRAESPGPPTERHFTMPRKERALEMVPRGRDRLGNFAGRPLHTANCILPSAFPGSAGTRKRRSLPTAFCFLPSRRLAERGCGRFYRWDGQPNLRNGAEGGTRTPTVLRPSAPQAGASANSATSA